MAASGQKKNLSFSARLVIVVTAAAGGVTDVVARAHSGLELHQAWGQCGHREQVAALRHVIGATPEPRSGSHARRSHLFNISAEAGAFNIN